MGESILKKRAGIEKQVDEFMDRVSEAGLLCKNGMESYLKGNMEAFAQAMTSIRETEHKGDALRRSIEQDLFTKTLIPESRGDVMELRGHGRAARSFDGTDLAVRNRASRTSVPSFMMISRNSSSIRWNRWRRMSVPAGPFSRTSTR